MHTTHSTENATNPHKQAILSHSQHDCEETYPTIQNMPVSSANEMTGLMYHPPISQAELDAYQDLYDMEHDEDLN